MSSLDRLTPVARAGTSSLIADQLRRLITDGTFAPGAQLLEAQIAERLGVSRGPVREATARLIQEGLLVAAPNRGVFVVKLDAEDVADLMLARAVIEGAAARLIRERGNSAAFDALEAFIDEAEAAGAENWTRLVDADLGFHESLVNAAASPRLSRMYRTLLSEARMCYAVASRQHYDPDRSIRQHRDLLHAIRSGDEPAMEHAIRAHITAANRVLSPKDERP
jgi:DNA-binding GntR family transcriptional regulator